MKFINNKPIINIINDNKYEIINNKIMKIMITNS